MKDFGKKLDEIEKKGLTRSLITLPSPGGKFTLNNKEYLNFSSNDYLNLANDSRVKEASKKAIDGFGNGSGGSRLMCGTLPLHEKLEEELAEWTGMEAAMVYGSGFLANTGAISALAEPDDNVLFDRLDHASIIDGVRLSGADWKRFKHNDTAELEALLKERTGNNFIVIDSVFSMDGDLAPVLAIKDLAVKYGAYLIVDEAHALGVFGGGKGVCAEKNIKPDMITGTFSKAFGGYGGFVACSSAIKKFLVSSSRSFIFSTALPPACLGGAMKALSIIREEKGLGKELLSNALYFHGLLKDAGLSIPEFSSQIIPVIIGKNERATAAASMLWEEGIYARAIRPPTVPQGTARLRLSVTLAHSRQDLKTAAEKIASAAAKGGLI